MPSGTAPTICALDGAPSIIVGSASVDQRKTYLLEPVVVPPGTARIEVAYEWAPAERAVLDLGMRGPGDRFAGWSGSREGRIHRGDAPIHIAVGDASRGYLPGIDPGVWHVELGVAAIPPEGATYRIEVACSSGHGHPAVAGAPDPVPRSHVANPNPGWYVADLQMHGYHSNSDAPEWGAAIDCARRAGLDICAFTEYVTTRHWDELGAVQRANPDMLIWPAREIVTYRGHALTFGATPGATEYRIGLDGVTMADIQRAATADGALFGLAHPTTFPEAEYGDFCRGCEYQLYDETDLDGVDTFEVVTAGTVVGGHVNPFVRTAIDRWESLLRAGHKMTAVGGSDDKLGPGYGSAATAILASELSIAAVAAALRSGRAYVKARGARSSPSVRLTATAGEQSATFGESLAADRAELEIGVRDAAGQHLAIRANGVEVERRPITADDWVTTVEIERRPGGGPLGTFWGLEVTDELTTTAVANPVFLRPEDPADATRRPAPG